MEGLGRLSVCVREGGLTWCVDAAVDEKWRLTRCCAFFLFPSSENPTALLLLVLLFFSFPPACNLLTDAICVAIMQLLRRERSALFFFFICCRQMSSRPLSLSRRRAAGRKPRALTWLSISSEVAFTPLINLSFPLLFFLPSLLSFPPPYSPCLL